jgi:hypothetical protein
MGHYVSSHYGDQLPDFRRYRLHVASTSVAEVVSSLGGFVSHTVRAGWEVTIYIESSEPGGRRR